MKKVAEHMILNELVPVAEEEYLFLMFSSPEHCSTQDVPPHISLGERDELKETIEKSIGKIVILEVENIILKEEIELLQKEKDVEKKKLMDQIDVLEVENRLLKENISVLHNTLRSQEEARKEEEVQMCNEALSIEYSGPQNSGETRDLVKETPKIYSCRRGRKRGRGRQIRTSYTQAHVEKKKVEQVIEVIDTGEVCQNENPFLKRQDYPGRYLISSTERNDLQSFLVTYVDKITVCSMEVYTGFIYGLFGERLIDDVIDAYAMLIHARALEDTFKYVQFIYISPNFLNLYVGGLTDSALHYIDHVTIESVSGSTLILNPVNCHDHWFLLSINLKTESITIYNSLPTKPVIEVK